MPLQHCFHSAVHRRFVIVLLAATALALPSRAATPAPTRIAASTVDFTPNLPLIIIHTTNSLSGDIKVP